jgi:hypothetical protein
MAHFFRSSVLCFALVVAGARSSAQAQAPPFPLTLQQAVQYAIEHYPAIQASTARVSAQQAGVDLARTAYLPRVDGARLPVYLVGQHAEIAAVWNWVALATAGAVIGTVLGSHVLRWIPEVWFRRVLAAVLAALGVIMVGRTFQP